VNAPLALTDLMPSIAANLDPAIAPGRLSFPPASHYVLVLVDGLGWSNLFDEASEAPVMRAMASQMLSVALPSTTAASLTSLTTGVAPSAHGVVGFSFRTRPGFVMNTMAWDDAQSAPEDVQPVPTLFQRLALPSAAIVPAIFTGSGMTRAYLRGAELVTVANESDWAARTAQVADVVPAHALTLVYERSLDHIAHLKGWGSRHWRRGLAAIDAFIGAIQQVLPPGTCLLVTGDHGMVDVPKTHRVFIEQEPALANGVDLIGGEARLRHLYTGDPAGVAARYQAWLGGRGQALLRGDALTLFGETAPSAVVRERIGDVVVAMNGDWALLTLTRPGEAGLMGMHGSWTPLERTVPLLVYVKGES